MSLDVMRGLVVAGMIIVNFSMVAAAVAHFDIYETLAHADWVGFTIADFVFPAFIMMVGVSIAVAFRNPAKLAGKSLPHIFWRTVRLFLLGICVSNFFLYWRQDWSVRGFHLMGVLQRIGLCYCVAAILYLCTTARTRLILACLILVLYWPLTLVPSPDGQPTNLHLAGANFVSWVDRAVLGKWIGEAGPLGFDPEGLLSTLPAVAQCLIGVGIGEWFLRHREEHGSLTRLTLAGGTLGLVGIAWSFAFPLIKSIWSSSYVLLSSGLTIILFAVCIWAFDHRHWRGLVAGFLSMFGENAIVAYILHIVALLVLELRATVWIYGAFLTFLPAKIATLATASLFLTFVAMPLAFLRWRGWTLRI